MAPSARGLLPCPEMDKKPPASISRRREPPPFLDSLRGLAALYVVLYHLPAIPQYLGIPPWAQRIVLFGGSGVTLFFIVSGFSLCLTMPAHQRTGAPLFSFYTKRLLRIAPLFYVVTVVMVMRAAFRDTPIDPA